MNAHYNLTHFHTLPMQLRNLTIVIEGFPTCELLCLHFTCHLSQLIFTLNLHAAVSAFHNIHGM